MQIQANQIQENKSIFKNMYVAVRATAINVGGTIRATAINVGGAVKNVLIVLGTHIVQETVRVANAYVATYTVNIIINWVIKKTPEIIKILREYDIIKKMYNYSSV